MKGELSENDLKYKAEAYCSSMERCVADVEAKLSQWDVYKRQPLYWLDPLILSKPYAQSIPIIPIIGRKIRTPTTAERFNWNGLNLLTSVHALPPSMKPSAVSYTHLISKMCWISARYWMHTAATLRLSPRSRIRKEWTILMKYWDVYKRQVLLYSIDALLPADRYVPVGPIQMFPYSAFGGAFRCWKAVSYTHLLFQLAHPQIEKVEAKK